MFRKPKSDHKKGGVPHQRQPWRRLCTYRAGHCLSYARTRNKQQGVDDHWPFECRAGKSKALFSVVQKYPATGHRSKHGATIIRVGTAIFEVRIYPDSYYWNEFITIKEIII